MKNFFTIAEYNPFHNGHRYHVEQMRSRGATHVAAVMSGNFVQRGEPALLDKFKRAEAAIAGGVDLILELPLPWSLSAAERFAFGAVRLISASGIADAVSFGCETEDAALLKNAAACLAARETREKVAAIRQNCSYPTAVVAALPADYARMVSAPNNILAVEYTQKLYEENFIGEIVPVKRFAVQHDSDETAPGFAGASYIRNLVRQGESADSFLPEASAQILHEAVLRGDYVLPRTCARQIVSLLRQLDRADFQSLPFADGGIGDRLYRAVQTETTLEEIYDAVKSKRFTHSSVRRLALSGALRVPRDFCRLSPPYLRVLGFNEKGREMLRAMREAATLPIIMKKSDTDRLDCFGKKVYALECRAGDLYNSFLRTMRPCGTEMTDNIYRCGV